MTQLRIKHQVYQSSFPELFERLENLTFEGETEVEVDGVVYGVTRGADPEGEFYTLQAGTEAHHVTDNRVTDNHVADRGA